MEEVHFYRGTIEQYNALVSGGRVNPNGIYCCTLAGGGFKIFLGSVPLVVG